MQITLMKGKIHRASVTQADLHYEGSISIDRTLLDAAGLLINIDTGARFATYVIEAPKGSGMIGLNGAAARLAMIGDKVIIVAYAAFEEAEARAFRPRVVLVDEENRILPVETRKADAGAFAFGGRQSLCTTDDVPGSDQ
jgi:aspartate 1-decarboxylase